MTSKIMLYYIKIITEEMPGIFSTYIKLQKVSLHGWALLKISERWRKQAVVVIIMIEKFDFLKKG